jgi:hypothetical protein
MADKDLAAACVFQLIQDQDKIMLNQGHMTGAGLVLPMKMANKIRDLSSYREFGDLPEEDKATFRQMAKAYFYTICDQISNEASSEEDSP